MLQELQMMPGQQQNDNMLNMLGDPAYSEDYQKCQTPQVQMRAMDRNSMMQLKAVTRSNTGAMSENNEVVRNSLAIQSHAFLQQLGNGRQGDPIPATCPSQSDQSNVLLEESSNNNGSASPSTEQSQRHQQSSPYEESKTVPAAIGSQNPNNNSVHRIVRRASQNSQLPDTSSLSGGRVSNQQWAGKFEVDPLGGLRQSMAISMNNIPPASVIQNGDHNCFYQRRDSIDAQSKAGASDFDASLVSSQNSGLQARSRSSQQSLGGIERGESSQQQVAMREVQRPPPGQTGIMPLVRPHIGSTCSPENDIPSRGSGTNSSHQMPSNLYTDSAEERSLPEQVLESVVQANHFSQRPSQPIASHSSAGSESSQRGLSGQENAQSWERPMMLQDSRSLSSHSNQNGNSPQQVQQRNSSGAPQIAVSPQQAPILLIRDQENKIEECGLVAADPNYNGGDNQAQNQNLQDSNGQQNQNNQVVDPNDHARNDSNVPQVVFGMKLRLHTIQEQSESQQSSQSRGPLSSESRSRGAIEVKSIESQELSENLGSVYLDEMIENSNVSFIMNDHHEENKQPPDLLAPPNNTVNNSSEDDNDDPNLMLSEEQKKDLSIRRKRLLGEYKKKLRVMRNEEILRKQEFLRQQKLENEGQNCADLPIIKMRENDSLNQSQIANKLNGRGASWQILQKANSHREHLRMNMPPLLSPRKYRHQNRSPTKDDLSKFKHQQRIREVKRRLMEQTALIRSAKQRFINVRAELVEIPEIEEQPVPSIEEEKDQDDQQHQLLQPQLIVGSQSNSQGSQERFEKENVQIEVCKIDVHCKSNEDPPRENDSGLIQAIPGGEERFIQSLPRQRLGDNAQVDYNDSSNCSSDQMGSSSVSGCEQFKGNKEELQHKPDINYRQLVMDLRNINIEKLNIPKELKVSLSNVKSQMQQFESQLCKSQQYDQDGEGLKLREINKENNRLVKHQSNQQIIRDSVSKSHQCAPQAHKSDNKINEKQESSLYDNDNNIDCSKSVSDSSVEGQSYQISSNDSADPSQEVGSDTGSRQEYSGIELDQSIPNSLQEKSMEERMEKKQQLCIQEIAQSAFGVISEEASVLENSMRESEPLSDQQLLINEYVDAQKSKSGGAIPSSPNIKRPISQSNQEINKWNIEEIKVQKEGLIEMKISDKSLQSEGEAKAKAVPSQEAEEPGVSPLDNQSGSVKIDDEEEEKAAQNQNDDSELKSLDAESSLIKTSESSSSNQEKDANEQDGEEQKQVAQEIKKQRRGGLRVLSQKATGPRRKLANRGILADKCQSSQGPDNYFVQQNLLQTEKIRSKGLPSDWVLETVRQNEAIKRMEEAREAKENESSSGSDSDDVCLRFGGSGGFGRV